MLPEQVVSENKKSFEWAKQNVNAIINMSRSGGLPVKDKMCYDLYFGLQNEGDFDYLTGSDEYRMPAKIRFMPIAKPYFELLKSTNEKRPIKPTVYAVDNGSVQQKKDRFARMLVDKLMARIEDGQSRLQVLRMQLDEQKAALGQEQEGPLPVNIQRAQMQIGLIERQISRGDSILQEEMDDLEKVRRWKIQTHQEVNMNHGLKYLIRKYDWKSIFDQCFEDLMIVDQQIVKIEDVYAGRDPKIRRVNPLTFRYGVSMDATWIDECPWTDEPRMMGVSQIMDEYGDHLTDEERGTLHKRYGWGQHGLASSDNYGWQSTNTFNSIPNGSLDGCATGIYSGSAMYTTDMIEVRTVCWKSTRRLRISRSPDKKNPDLLHTHLIGDEDRVKKGEQIEVRYVSDWWTGTRIGADIYVKCHKIPFQHRDIDDIGNSYNQYIGWAYNGLDKRPYSRVYATKDISILYNLVYLQMEMLIALSGIKGVIMDKSQVPEGMEMEEWFYHFKQGVGWIDSQKMQANGRIGTNFNQFQAYDITFGNSIQQLSFILERLEYLAGRVIGIPPQRLGEVTRDTQVGSQKQAIAQSNLTTETLFYKDQRFRNRVLDRVINVCTHVWKEGKRGQYVLGSLGQQVFEITSGDLDGVKLETFMDDDGRNEAIMDRAISAMELGYQRGTMMLGQLVEAYSMENLGELKETVRVWEEMARRAATGQQQSEAEAEQMRIQMEAQAKALVKKQLSDGEKLKAQLEEAALQIDQSRIQAESESRMADASIKSRTQLEVAQGNNAVEMAYLEEQKRETNLETRLRQLEIQMNGGSKNDVLSSPRPKNAVKSR